MVDPRAWVGDSADALYVVDHYQRIVRWNGAAERLLGAPAGEALNRPCHEVIRGCGRDGKRVCGPNCAVRKAVEAGELPRPEEINVASADGRRLWLRLGVIVVPHDPGPLTLHVLHDISDGRYAAEAMAEVASLCRSHRLGARGNYLTGAEDHTGAPLPPATPKANCLTCREREVLRLLTKGLSNSGIAVGLGLSVHTVRNHVQHILEKSRARNRAEAVSLAWRGQLR